MYSFGREFTAPLGLLWIPGLEPLFPPKVPHNLHLASFQLSTTDSKLRLVGRGQGEAGAEPRASKSAISEGNSRFTERDRSECVIRMILSIGALSHQAQARTIRTMLNNAEKC